MSVDIVVGNVIIEYDGCYYHDTESKTSIDVEKTTLLLTHGYRVIRVREQGRTTKLKDLPITHENLLQLQYTYHKNLSGLSSIASEILFWVENSTTK